MRRNCYGCHHRWPAPKHCQRRFGIDLAGERNIGDPCGLGQAAHSIAKE